MMEKTCIGDVGEIGHVLGGKGVCKIEKYFDVEEIQKLKTLVDEVFLDNDNDCLSSAYNIKDMKEGNLKATGAELNKDVSGPEELWLDNNDLSQGVEHYRNLTNARSLKRPLLLLPDLVQLVLDDFLLDIASKYLECEAKLTFVKIIFKYCWKICNL